MSCGSNPWQEELHHERFFPDTRISVSLESLPPELRVHILSSLGLDQLRALTQASPVFHQDYRHSRRYVLSECLQATLKNVFVDAYAAYQSSLDEFEGWRTEETVRQFLQSYQSRRLPSYTPTYIEQLTEDEAIGMVTFYYSTIKPLARLFVEWALNNLSEETKGLPDIEQLSKAEEIRVFRALYRFQLCCNLFGQGLFRASGELRWAPLYFRSVDIVSLFLHLFEPWEVEEIACIYAFAREKYEHLFEDIRWDVHKKNPKFNDQRRSPTPDGAFDLDDSYTRHFLIVGTVSRGLDLLCTVSSGVSDHARLVSIMQAQITLPEGRFLEREAFGECAQRFLRQKQLSPRDQKQLRRDTLLFTGDGDSETEGPQPPQAWTVMWGGTYSNLFGDYVPDSIRRWGYVFWDATRLERTGAEQVLLWQCKVYWEDSDPRENL